MMDDGYPYYPEPCTESGHVYGCSGRAGGEHQVDMPKGRAMSNEARLALGKMIFEQFIMDETGSGANPERAIEWLVGRGFDRAEWASGDADDILLLSLWRYFGLELVDEFIIKFSGYDAANIGVFNLVGEVSL